MPEQQNLFNKREAGGSQQNTSRLLHEFEREIKRQEQKKGITNKLSGAKITLENIILKIDETKDRIKNYENDIKDIKKKHPNIKERMEELINEIHDNTKQLKEIIHQKTIAKGKLMIIQELKGWENKIMTKLEDLNKAHKITSRELQDLKNEENDLNQKFENLTGIEDDSRKAQGSLTIYESKKSKLERDVEKLTKEEKKIQEEIGSLSKRSDKGGE